MEETCLVGESPAMRALRGQIEKIAPLDVAVVVLGETGSGKELVARAIHAQSLRANQSFIAINCGAIPESLAESILFGYEGGAFSGGMRAGRIGLLEQANGGTLFLDETAEMPPRLQAMMLRTLQNFRIRRVGATHVSQLDLRIISATNKDLRQRAKAGRFRQDLFYRLDVIPLEVPPLRKRKGDIPLLVNHFLQFFGQKYGREYKISADLIKKFEKYHWPGNVRELINFLEYGACFSADGYITRKIMDHRFAMADEAAPATTQRHVNDDAIDALLNLYGSGTAAKKAIAGRLGISVATLYRRLRKNRLAMESGTPGDAAM